MRVLKTYLLLLCLCFFATLFAQNDGIIIDESSWEEAKKEIDYTETFKEFDDKKPKEASFDNISPLSYDWSALKYIFYAIVICLVLFLLYKIFSNHKRNPNIKIQDLSVESIQEIEEKIHEIDLQQLLKEALLQENYQVALRINFLIIIKLLSEQNQISWAKEKTNWEYYSEIKDILKKDGFKILIIAFEPVWYGEHLLTKQGFEQLQPLFNNYQQQLTPNE